MYVEWFGLIEHVERLDSPGFETGDLADNDGPVAVVPVAS
jgi:hypothetical protein